jgi:hypothetical protein
MNQTLTPAKGRMLQNKAPLVAAECVRQMLREIAFVLHATRKVKRSILMDWGEYDPSEWTEPTRA